MGKSLLYLKYRHDEMRHICSQLAFPKNDMGYGTDCVGNTAHENSSQSECTSCYQQGIVDNKTLLQ